MMLDNRVMLDATEVESRIVDFIRNELLDPDVAFDRHDDLLSGELIDSVAVLRLAAFVEEVFPIHMQPKDYVIENFRTVAALADFVLKRTNAGGGSS